MENCAPRVYVGNHSIGHIVDPDGFICFDHLLGLLAETQGDLDQAMAHFEDALAFCRKAGYRPELAWSPCDYAEMLPQRNKPGDKRKGMSLLDEALAVSSELGMRPLTERVIALQERVQSQPTKALAYPAGLTEREVSANRAEAASFATREGLA
jgi:hypothetical protein